MFSRKIPIKADMARLYNAWTRADEIESWFLRSSNFLRGDRLLPKEEAITKGDTYQWAWYAFDVVEEGSITEANGVDFIQFTFAGDCLVEIQLTQMEDYVLVTLTQKNIPTDDASKRNIRIGCASGWSFFLVNLKSVYEGGLDLRNKDNDLRGMLNN
jgi:uncharacterized protein YndB with AHSA1/START domain